MEQAARVDGNGYPTAVKALYDEIKEALGIMFVPQLFEALAQDPETLSAVWRQFRALMGPGELTRREKELVALAVSAAHNFRECLYPHTSVLKALGLNEKGILELIAVVGLFKNLNRGLEAAVESAQDL